MNRDPRYDILFEPVAIGPLVAKNRFYQPPHCNGLGEHRPHMHAAMRATKAEGGWAVINTEHCSIAPSDDILGEVVQTLWDDGDIANLALMTDAVHEHGALAGVQLAHSSYYAANRSTREVGLGPDARPIAAYDPVQTRAMDKRDIRELLRWQAQASVRAKTAGFDIINIDANFSTTAFQFLSPRNRRIDEYGGSIANRARLLGELIEVTRAAVGPDIAVTVRLIIDELLGSTGLQASEDGVAVVAHLDDLVDLWDLIVGTWADDSPTSRFAAEASHEPMIAQFRAVTDKPIVGVGRFTSPDTMVRQIKRGVLDMIGATRPSIADPFLPRKIEEGRAEDIRECIGCNICVSGHMTMSPIRCTQNPTMGEEWRRGWHPERIRPKGSEASVLVVGAGPAGLECARALGARGYPVTLAEATRELGGRVSTESRLPGLSEWGRVRDWRLGQLDKLANVSVYRESELTAEQVVEFGFEHVVIATGGRWRKDGYGRAHNDPIPGLETAQIYTPDDLMAGAKPEGPVVVYDDDHYYMGNVLAEKLRRDGLAVTLVTPAPDIAAFTRQTLELEHVYRRLAELDVAMHTYCKMVAVDARTITMKHLRSGAEVELDAASIVMVTAREPNDQLYQELQSVPEALESAGIASVTAIGDANAPSAIVHAVYAGHRYAQELDVPLSERLHRRDRAAVFELAADLRNSTQR